MAAPIPRTLEAPPRTTGNPQRDLPILIDWFYRAWQVVQQSINYINSQVNNPDFSVADLPDPTNTTLANAQQTANDAYNLANTAINRLNGFVSGTFTISDTDVGVELVFSTPQLDTDYRVIIQPVSFTGTPVDNAFIVKTKTYATDKFTVIMLAAPDTSNSVTYEWQLIRNS